MEYNLKEQCSVGKKTKKSTGLEAEMLGLKFYLANKLVCYCFMDAGKRQTPRSETMDFITSSSPCPQVSQDVIKRSFVDSCTHS